MPMSDPSHAPTARARVRQGRSGTLATLSTAEGIEGHPFGSVVPYATDRQGRPILLLSRIAEHTRNLLADPRASLLVRDEQAAGDPQASWRMTLVGRAARLPRDEEEHEEIRARYLEVVPGARAYEAAHDFDFWRLVPARIRWIEGFGKIRWADLDAYGAQPGAEAMAEAGPGILAHMNDDHEDALGTLCEAFRGFRPAGVRMVAIDPGGFLVRTRDPERTEFFSFPVEIEAADTREAMIRMLGEARAALAAGEGAEA